MSQVPCHIFSSFSPDGLTVVPKGRNNDVRSGEFGSYREKVVLKRYPQNRSERFSREIVFLEHCERLGISSVPGLVEVCLNHLVIVLKGRAGLRPEIFSEDHETQIIDFLLALQQETSQQTNIPESIEATWNTNDFTKSLLWRREVLQKDVQQGKVASKDVDSFEVFERYLMSGLFRNDLKWLGHAIDQTSSVPGRDLRFISPSDLGAHNCLEHDGRLSFLDFEYAGTDSGINLAGDLAMQPDSLWASGDRHRIGARVVHEVFESDSYDSDRVERLFGTRWSLVALLRRTRASEQIDEDGNDVRKFPSPNYIEEVADCIEGKI